MLVMQGNQFFPPVEYEDYFRVALATTVDKRCTTTIKREEKYFTTSPTYDYDLFSIKLGRWRGRWNAKTDNISWRIGTALSFSEAVGQQCMFAPHVPNMVSDSEDAEEVVLSSRNIYTGPIFEFSNVSVRSHKRANGTTLLAYMTIWALNVFY